VCSRASCREYALDPTLSRPKGDKKRCPKCGHNEVVYFTVSDENIEIVFLCCNQNCAHQWKEDVQTAAPAPRAAAS
jgi:DNA-directed RNA polymerase II subunit RPB9